MISHTILARFGLISPEVCPFLPIVLKKNLNSKILRNTIVRSLPKRFRLYRQPGNILSGSCFFNFQGAGFTFPLTYTVYLTYCIFVPLVYIVVSNSTRVARRSRNADRPKPAIPGARFHRGLTGRTQPKTRCRRWGIGRWITIQLMPP